MLTLESIPGDHKKILVFAAYQWNTRHTEQSSPKEDHALGMRWKIAK